MQSDTSLNVNVYCRVRPRKYVGTQKSDLFPLFPGVGQWKQETPPWGYLTSGFREPLTGGSSKTAQAKGPLQGPASLLPKGCARTLSSLAPPPAPDTSALDLDWHSMHPESPQGGGPLIDTPVLGIVLLGPPH